MSYLVLARKWRPKTFDEVVGQQHVTSTLMKAFEKGRLAHAYLFSGPRGCGKTTTARLLAKIINCEDPQGAEPCNKCSSCLAVNSGNHLDMIEIDGASNRGIDEIRDLREKIGYASAQSKSKIYIIDEVHMLTQQAFNALLKTLEEPPGHVYLIFATTEPHKVPATILSRCQRFNFKRLELAELAGQLARICDQEDIGHDPEALTLICRRADGSMRDAESLLDQCISASDGKIDLQTVREVLGLVDSQIVASLLDAVSRRDREGALQVVDGVVSSGMDLEEFFLAFLEGIRNLLVISVSADKTGWLDLTAGEIEDYSALAKRFHVEDLLFLFRTMSRSFRELKTSNQQRYHIEAAVAEAASWDSAVDIGDLIERLESGGTGGRPETGGGKRAGRSPEGRGGIEADGRAADRSGSSAPEGGSQGSAGRASDSTGGVQDAAAEVPQRPDSGGAGNSDYRPVPVNRTSVSIDAPPRENPFLAPLGGKEEWERFLAQVRESKLTLGIWLMSAEVAGIEGDRLILSFSSQHRFAMEMIREAKNRRLIESHLEKFYGRKFTVEACETTGSRQGSGRSGSQAEMELAAKTRPKTGKSSRSQPGPKRAAGGRGGAQAGAGLKGRGKASEVDNPTLNRIIKEFDAEILD